MSIARDMFNIDRKDYMPHLSLMYGDFSQKTKENVIKSIGRDFNMSFKAEDIHLVFNNERDKVWTEKISIPFGVKDYAKK